MEGRVGEWPNFLLRGLVSVDVVGCACSRSITGSCARLSLMRCASWGNPHTTETTEPQCLWARPARPAAHWQFHARNTPVCRHEPPFVRSAHNRALRACLGHSLLKRLTHAFPPSESASSAIGGYRCRILRGRPLSDMVLPPEGPKSTHGRSTTPRARRQKVRADFPFRTRRRTAGPRSLIFTRSRHRLRVTRACPDQECTY